MSKAEIPLARIRQAIIMARGQRVILDRDLAELYRVETRTLKQAVRKNAARFPEDLMKVVFDAIRHLMAPPDPPRKEIGFRIREPGAKYRTRRR